MKKINIPALKDFLSIFSKYGDPGERYVVQAYKRMCITKQFALEKQENPQNLKLLDIGGHWLHSSVLYAMDGVSVTAGEVAAIDEFLTSPMISNVAKEFRIKQITYKDLSNPIELGILPTDSFDIILFCEILEHITFNPVKMWTELYRVLKPGGRIIVTTPNFFYITNLINNFAKPFFGKSPGLSVREIIGQNTFGHHWKLYSVKDITDYFKLLSPDFVVSRSEYFTYTPCNTLSPLRLLKRAVEFSVKQFREALYVEILLPNKDNGITAKPAWWI